MVAALGTLFVKTFCPQHTLGTQPHGFLPTRGHTPLVWPKGPQPSFGPDPDSDSTNLLQLIEGNGTNALQPSNGHPSNVLGIPHLI